MLASILAWSLATPPVASPPRFTGAFRGIEVGFGGVFGATDGQSVSLSGRAASVVYLADVALTYRAAIRESTAHHLSVAARLHPFFLFLLANNRWGATIGAFYLELGVGGLAQAGDLAATWQWGTGIDVPLVGDLDQDGLWLGAELVRTCSFTGARAVEAVEEDAITAVSLRLGWRFNGL